ncbi:MAG: hypothetical protein NUV52_01795 [Candidatus Roizmanbacteria bacterium]|nr:hypothetical protein [Candidatus Roizmanbacteria bacterium]
MGPGKEAEPVRTAVAETSRGSAAEIEPVQKPETEQYLEQVSDDIPLSEDEKKLGASHPPAQGTLIVDGRMIHLPISLEEVDDGLHKPLSSGKRWMAMMVRYILDKLHLVIRNVGGHMGVIRAR